MNILIVCNDDMTLELLEPSLVAGGHQLTVCPDAREALSILKSASFRMLISDWRPTGMDGVKLCRQVRKAHLPCALYLMLLTPWIEEREFIEGLSAGADDILAKPIQPAELRLRVHHAERMLRLEDELSAARCSCDESETRLGNVFDTARDAMLIIDGVGDRIVDANPAACDMFERSRSELLSMRASDLHCHHNETLRALLYNNLSVGTGVTEEIHFRTKSGGIFPAEVSASIVDLDGTLCTLSLIRDISERRHSELQLVEHTKALEQGNLELRQSQLLLEKKNQRLSNLFKMAQIFVDNVSHEFRTPLTVIKEYADLLAEGAMGSICREQQRFLGVIADRADDLNTMVDDMLDSSKLDSGMLGIVRKSHRISDIIDHVHPVLERKAHHKGVKLVVDIDDSLPDVYVDDEKVGRILINLAGNAIKFAGDPGRVQIWARAAPGGSEVIVGVTDNGPGIALGHQREIFERFKQLEGQGRGSCKGFGLGLSIARELAELNLGELTLESQPGLGTTLKFTLPANDPAEVLSRYLARLEHLNRRSPIPPIMMLTAGVQESAPSLLADEVDAFLNHVLQGNDLAFRLQTRGWLIFAPLEELEWSGYLAKLERAWQDTNRNRLREALPAIDFEIVKSWPVESKQEMVRSLLDELETRRGLNQRSLEFV
ncbi:hybrid sensor histidine kinase/response regulator [Planctomicrobium piriforme]|nr:ATP-binding protein [Planctomicrobium piriforme]